MFVLFFIYTFGPFLIFSFFFFFFVEINSPYVNFVFTAVFVQVFVLFCHFHSCLVCLSFPSLFPRVRGDNVVMIVVLVVMGCFVQSLFDIYFYMGWLSNKF